MQKATAIVALTMGMAISAGAQGDIEVTALQTSGKLEWSGCAAGTPARVEWAARLESGTTQWNTFTNVTVSSGVMSVEIPMAFRVVGTPAANWPTQYVNFTSASLDLALTERGATATASSYGSYAGYDAVASEAIDGRISGWHTLTDDPLSLWAPTAIPAWLELDLGQERRIYELLIYFSQHTLTIDVQASLDGVEWFEIVSSQEVNPKRPGDPPASSMSRHRFDIIPSAQARYVKLNITATDAPGSHIYKADIDEVIVTGF